MIACLPEGAIYAVALCTKMRDTFPSHENNATSRHKIGIIWCLKCRVIEEITKNLHAVAGPAGSWNCT